MDGEEELIDIKEYNRRLKIEGMIDLKNRIEKMVQEGNLLEPGQIKMIHDILHWGE